MVSSRLTGVVEGPLETLTLSRRLRERERERERERASGHDNDVDADAVGAATTDGCWQLPSLKP